MTTEIYTYLHPLSLHDALPICLPPLVVLPVRAVAGLQASLDLLFDEADHVRCGHRLLADRLFEVVLIQLLRWLFDHRLEEHTSELQSIMRISYAVFCLKKKKPAITHIGSLRFINTNNHN